MIYEEANIDNLKQPVIIYGAGVFGELAFIALSKLNIKPIMFCDRVKNGNALFDIPVVSPDELVKYKSASILMAVGASFFSVLQFLDELGCTNILAINDLLNNTKFNTDELKNTVQDIEYFKNVYKIGSEYNPNGEKIDVLSVDYVITERCSLKCRDCSNLMQYYDKSCDYDLIQQKNSFNRFLDYVNSVVDLRIIGGEPFMHRDFGTALEQFSGNPKIKIISIFTNATILPKEKYIELLKNDKIKVVITDYKELSKNTHRFIEILKVNNIRYVVNELKYWQDLGGLNFRNYTTEEKLQVFKECDCHSIPTFLKGKLYLCPYSAHGDNLKAFHEKDYIDFNEDKNNENIEAEIRQLLYNKEYLEACGYCSGRNIKLNRIEPAIQVKEPLEYERMLYE